MKVYIRCDGSPVIGLGHIMRMLALAKGFRTKMIETIFITKDLSLKIAELIRKDGFNVITVPNKKVIDDFKVDIVQEREIFNKHVASGERNILIIDHYGYTADLIKSLREKFNKLVLVDDFQPERFNSCYEAVDILLNPNFSANEIKYKRDGKALCLLGPYYALLRGQFKNNKVYKVRPNCENVLIYFGGRDSLGLTLPIMNIVDSLDTSMNITVITGLEKTEDDKLSSKNRIAIKSNVENMFQELYQQDLVIIPASTIALEAASIGVPSCIFVSEENQRLGGIAMGKLGVAKFLGSYENSNWSVIKQLIKNVIKDYSIRVCMSEKGKNTVATNGPEKIIKEILGG